MDVWGHLVAGLAAFAAGAINALAGGGTLVSFPALLWAGVPPITANATNTVALWPGLASSTFGFRNDLRHADRALIALGLVSLVCGGMGAAVLLNTPEDVFETLAPFLLLAGTLLLAVRRPARRGHGGTEPHRTPPWWAVAIAIQAAIAAYGGYFGAGMGILILAQLSLLGFGDMHRMNALKNFYSFCIKAAAVVYFAAQGAVAWSIAIVMAVAAVAGGFLGARLAYRWGRERVRAAVVVIGVLMSLSLLLRLLD